MRFVDRLRRHVEVSRNDDHCWLPPRDDDGDESTRQWTTQGVLDYLLLVDGVPEQLVQDGGAPLRRLVLEAVDGRSVVHVPWDSDALAQWMSRVLGCVPCNDRCCAVYTDGDSPILRFVDCGLQGFFTANQRGHIDCVRTQLLLHPTNARYQVTTSKFLQGNSTLDTVCVPYGVTSLGSHFAADCDRLASVVLPSSLTSIMNDFAVKCPMLTVVDLRDCRNLVSIDQNFLNGCGALRSVALPASLRRLGMWFCAECDNLSTVDVSACCVLTTLDDTFLVGCSRLTEVALPAGRIWTTSAEMKTSALHEWLWTSFNWSENRHVVMNGPLGMFSGHRVSRVYRLLA